MSELVKSVLGDCPIGNSKSCLHLIEHYHNGNSCRQHQCKPVKAESRTFPLPLGSYLPDKLVPNENWEGIELNGVYNGLQHLAMPAHKRSCIPQNFRCICPLGEEWKTIHLNEKSIIYTETSLI